MKRRHFLRQLGTGTLAAGAVLGTGCQQQGTAEQSTAAPTAGFKPVKWKMVTTWPKNFPGLGTGANTLAKLAKAYGVSPLTLMKEAGLITEGHLRTPDAMLRSPAPTSELSRGEMETMLKRALNSINQLTREVETLRRVESVRDIQQGGARERPEVVYAPVLSGQLEAMSLPPAPRGVMPVSSDLLQAPERGVVLQVTGEEMSPDLQPGDLVLAERDRRPESQGIVAVKHPEGIAFQQLSTINGTVVLTSNNPDYSYLNQLVEREQGSVVYAQVLAVVWRRLV